MIVAAPLIAATSATASASEWPEGAPEGGYGAQWSTCADSASQYCVEKAQVNGQDRRANVWILDGSPQSINFEFPSLYDIQAPNSELESQHDPIDLSVLDDTVELKVRVGSWFKPNYTTAYATGFTQTVSEDESGNKTVTYTGKPMHAFWNRDAGEQACTMVACDGNLVATQEVTAFSGNTQNMSTWGEDAIERFGGMYIATNAQTFAPTVSHSESPIEEGGAPVHWNYQVANPHFELDGVTPATGSFEAFLPGNYFTAIGATPASSLFSASRCDADYDPEVGCASEDLETLPGTTTAAHGGARLDVPALHYSAPRLLVRQVNRPVIVVAPSAVRSLRATGRAAHKRIVLWTLPAKNGNAAINGYRVAMTRTYVTKVKVGRKWKNKRITATVLNRIQTATSYTFVPKTEKYRFTVAARNAGNKFGPASALNIAGR